MAKQWRQLPFPNAKPAADAGLLVSKDRVAINID